ncbi:MAG: hypothetical protein ABI743_04115 [bacterium]
MHAHSNYMHPKFDLTPEFVELLGDWFEQYLEATAHDEEPDDIPFAHTPITIRQANGYALTVMAPMGPVDRCANPIGDSIFEMDPERGCFAQPGLPLA